MQILGQWFVLADDDAVMLVCHQNIDKYVEASDDPHKPLEVFDDSLARQDWGWKHRIGLEQLVDIMITNLRSRSSS